MKRIIKKMEIVSYATREEKTTTWFYYSLFSFVIELITLTIRISANYMKRLIWYKYYISSVFSNSCIRTFCAVHLHKGLFSQLNYILETRCYSAIGNSVRICSINTGKANFSFSRVTVFYIVPAHIKRISSEGILQCGLYTEKTTSACIVHSCKWTIRLLD